MTGYIFICLAVVCFTAQFAFTKGYEGAVKQTVTTSLLLLILTGIVGGLLFFFAGGASVSFSLPSLLYAVFFAGVMIPYYMLGIKALSLGSLAIYSMFMMLGGMLVPFFYGILFLSEPISPAMLVGSILLTVFIILQALSDAKKAKKNKRRTRRDTLLFALISVAIFFVNGLTGVIAKAHQLDSAAVDEASFTVLSSLLTAFFSAIVLLFLFLFDREKTVDSLRPAVKPRPLLWSALVGVAAHTGNFLHLLAASTLPASVQFPIVSGGVIVLSALASILIFREKMSRVDALLVAGVFLATFLFAF